MSLFRLYLGAFLSAMLSTWFCWHIFAALKRGVANAAGKLYRRSQRPVMFWLAVGGQIFFAVLLFYSLIRAIVRIVG